jgi:hypothetical protein
LDGKLLTNGPPVTIWPGANVLANGFYVGGDSTGIAQAHGMFDDLETFNYPLAGSSITTMFIFGSQYFYGNPMNRANFTKASSYPTNTPTFDVVSGTGGLTNIGPGPCVQSSSVWITNVSATVLTNGTMNVTFAILGNWNGNTGPFDVFANSILGPTNLSAFQWAWQGQGYSCNTYMLTNLPLWSAYLILGTPQDSNGDGLTDAYSILVLRTSPYTISSANDGIPDAWKVLWGMNPLTPGLASQDLDSDGLSNWQEYLWGTNPQHSEGIGVWVSSPAGFCGIP